MNLIEVEFATRSMTTRPYYKDSTLKLILVVNSRSGYDEYWKVHYEVPIKFGFEL